MQLSSSISWRDTVDVSKLKWTPFTYSNYFAGVPYSMRVLHWLILPFFILNSLILCCKMPSQQWIGSSREQYWQSSTLPVRLGNSLSSKEKGTWICRVSRKFSQWLVSVCTKPSTTRQRGGWDEDSWTSRIKIEPQIWISWNPCVYCMAPVQQWSSTLETVTGDSFSDPTQIGQYLDDGYLPALPNKSWNSRTGFCEIPSCICIFTRLKAWS